MAEIWGAAIVAGAAVYSASKSASAAKAGANAQTNAANAGIAEQQRQYDQSRADQAPWLDAGKQALALQQNYLGGDTSGFDNASDYKFAVQQGTRQLDAGATANGNLWGGGADADRIALGQGLATQYANNYWNKLAGMAAGGQNAAANVGSLGSNAANQISGQYNNIGQANASSYAAGANAYGNAAGQIANLAGQYFNRPSTSSSYGNSYIGGNGTGGYGMQTQTPSANNIGYAPSTLTF